MIAKLKPHHASIVKLFVALLAILVVSFASPDNKGRQRFRSDAWKYVDRNVSQVDSDTPLRAYLNEVSLLSQQLEHTGAAPFDEHLLGVQAVLRTWGADEELCKAALFHSLYGTEGYQGFKLPLSERSRLRALIGPRAERLVWIFCMVERESVDATLFLPEAQLEYKFTARGELGRFTIQLRGREEWLDFLELTLADWLEQVEGAASKALPQWGYDVGDAWGYRRIAYHKMAEILTSERAGERQRRLAGVADAMLADVYGAESDTTKSKHFPVTPALTEAAKEAKAALEAAALYNSELEMECVSNLA